uniref:Uncharacterized protein n=1 Tax=Vespula pensylvanica TaxID=30213 RepID=A0A834NYA5_VESPE|nr:hypothetical protein H0235_009273 [Vespula pensylvanica]
MNSHQCQVEAFPSSSDESTCTEKQEFYTRPVLRSDAKNVTLLLPLTLQPEENYTRTSDLYRNSLNHSKNEKTSNNVTLHNLTIFECPALRSFQALKGKWAGKEKAFPRVTCNELEENREDSSFPSEFQRLAYIAQCRLHILEGDAFML